MSELITCGQTQSRAARMRRLLASVAHSSWDRSYRETPSNSLQPSHAMLGDISNRLHAEAPTTADPTNNLKNAVGVTHTSQVQAQGRAQGRVLREFGLRARQEHAESWLT